MWKLSIYNQINYKDMKITINKKISMVKSQISKDIGRYIL